MKYLSTLLLLAFHFISQSQEIFVSTWEYPDQNKLWNLNVENCELTYISTCELSNLSGGGWEYHIGDIAIDNNQIFILYLLPEVFTNQVQVVQFKTLIWVVSQLL